MPAEPLPPLLERRLIIVTGKGGTGKTTIATALGVAAARRGHSVLLAEMGGQEQIPQRVHPGHPPVGNAACELRPRLTTIHIDPFEALAEYLGLQTHLRGVVDLFMRNRGVSQLLEAAPGWRELITLGKLWHLAQMEDGEGRRLYELIVVDAPATGHGMTFLDVPRVVGSAVRAGPLRVHARRVEEFLRDPDQTLLLPVSLAEELPARETVELVRRAQTGIGMAVDRVIANAVAPDPFPAPVPADLEQRLRCLGDDVKLGELPTASVLAECGAYLRARYALNASCLEQLRQDCGQPLVTLPYRPGQLAGADALDAFAQPLFALSEAG